MLDRLSLGHRSRLTAVVKDVISGNPQARIEYIETNLRQAGLTSLDLVKLVLGVEREFGVEVDADGLDPENFETLEALEALVRRLEA